MIVGFGIKNCDTCRAAIKWLDSISKDFRFHDVRKEGLDLKVIRSWSDFVGWEALLNKRGSTWRRLPDSVKLDINASNAPKYMAENVTLIKRPVFDISGNFFVGFHETKLLQLIAKE